MIPLIWNSRNNKAIMIESRSVVARGPRHGGRWLIAKEHRDIYWLMEIFHNTIIVVIMQWYLLLKTHQIAHLRMVNLLFVKYTLNQSDFKNTTLSTRHGFLWATSAYCPTIQQNGKTGNHFIYSYIVYDLFILKFLKHVLGIDTVFGVTDTMRKSFSHGKYG